MFVYQLKMKFLVLIIFLNMCIHVCVCVRRQLSSEEVARGVQLLEEGHTQRDVAARLHVSRSVVARFWRRFQETGQYVRRHGQGRQRMTTQNQDRYIHITCRRNRHDSARSVRNQFQNAHNMPISTQTIRNRLHEGNLYARRPEIRPRLTAQHRRLRLDFSRNHVNWRLHNWQSVLFTDESRFTVSSNDRRNRVWRGPGERFHAENIVETARFGDGSVMVWGGICLQGRTDLVVLQQGTMTAQRYRNEVLQPIVRPFAGAIGDNFILMQDNARPHTARATMAYLESESIEVMDWPSCSPDLNPIEHIWDYLGRRVRSSLNPPMNIQQLIAALQQEWTQIPQDVIVRCIRSMQNRCRECIQARGGHTHY